MGSEIIRDPNRRGEPAVEPIDELPAKVVAMIRRRLDELRREHDIVILHAIESGSRAWGFPSPDSDFDVRFLYAHQPDWYLSVFEQRDVVETPIEEVDGAIFDVNGWDLRKALRLLVKSNPVLVEWLQSPINYGEDGGSVSGFREEMRELLTRYYSPRAAHHHYYSMARRNFREYLGGDLVKLKKYFYVLRPLLACQWIERDMGLPPMQLTELLDGVMPAGALRDDILQLRERKMREPEVGAGLPIPSIHAFLQSELKRLATISPPVGGKNDHRELDVFLRRWARQG